MAQTLSGAEEPAVTGVVVPVPVTAAVEMRRPVVRFWRNEELFMRFRVAIVSMLFLCAGAGAFAQTCTGNRAHLR